ncbi:GroES-like protein [Gonapodya prolifera JEL478]|uniref:GroES-like protein n=1 Tax=Gonapodya prolifera (strain JEL478) TaxID=1344416 RepID=A0A139AK91_GONPJ|nr:GroES-like protein [Gonapodya prolifera JEL478]|eukprot:KXS17186.1 GroES-like protein [Gonapodya prolifera JEL478]
MSTYPYPAVVVSAANGARLQANPQTPYPPVPGPGEVLIRNVAVASNPKDWKLSAMGIFDGHIEGNDVAGYIEGVGSNVKDFKKGDKADRYGAYQTHTVAPASTTFPLGPTISFEDAAVVPLASLTAALGVFQKLRLLEPSVDGMPNPKTKGQGVLIWGASSSVGTYAVQFAKRAGYYVIGIAGSGAATALSFGCDAVVDYRDGDVVVTNVESVHGPDGVLLQYVGISKMGSLVGDEELATKWTRIIGNWLERGILKPNVVRVIPGGLAGIRHGLELLRQGKISGEKLVCE